MSRVGDKGIDVPAGVSVDMDGALLSIKGGLGAVDIVLPDFLSCSLKNNTIRLLSNDKRRCDLRRYWGLYRVRVANAVLGVSSGFTLKLSIVGVGYRVALVSNCLHFSLGYSHFIVFDLPDGVSAKIESNTLFLTGIDKQLLGDFAARIRAFRPPEPYKSKGIQVNDEFIRRKEGKK